MWGFSLEVKSRVQGLNAAATAGFEPRTVWSEVRRRNRLATAPLFSPQGALTRRVNTRLRLNHPGDVGHIKGKGKGNYLTSVAKQAKTAFLHGPTVYRKKKNHVNVMRQEKWKRLNARHEGPGGGGGLQGYKMVQVAGPRAQQQPWL